MAKEHADAAPKTLVSVANNQKGPSAARVSSASAILDRACGKPCQSVEVDASTIGALTVTYATTPRRPGSDAVRRGLNSKESAYVGAANVRS